MTTEQDTKQCESRICRCVRQSAVTTKQSYKMVQPFRIAFNKGIGRTVYYVVTKPPVTKGRSIAHKASTRMHVSTKLKILTHRVSRDASSYMIVRCWVTCIDLRNTNRQCIPKQLGIATSRAWSLITFECVRTSYENNRECLVCRLRRGVATFKLRDRQ